MPNLNDSGNNSLRNNPFTKVFEKFSTEGTQQRLDAKFEHKPYHIEYKLLRLTALLTSYLFNGFSALTAAALIFFFVKSLAGSIAAGVVTVGSILAIEAGKRFIGSAFFKQFLQYQKFAGGLFAVMLLLIGLSIVSSYFGGKQAVKVFSGNAVVVSTDSTTAQVEEQIAAIDNQIAELSKQKDNKGTIYWTAQKAIDKLAEQKSILMPELVRTRQKTDADNTTAIAAHTQATSLKGEHFALVTLLCELLFLLCAYYLEFYDWRSFVELKAKPTEHEKSADTNATVTNATISNPNLNGQSVPDSTEYGTSNRVVIQGFQPHTMQSANATVIMQPLAAGEKHCLQCGKTFKYKVNWQKFCSNKGEGNCKDTYHAAQHDGRSFAPGLYHNQKA